jgi:heme exporter protein A
MDFQLEPGEALVLLGPNGSGKSSLLRLLAGLLRIHGGRLMWGEEILGSDREGHVGRLHYVGHQDAVKPVLSVRENLLFWARLHDPMIAASKIDMALAGMDLLALAETPAKLLSAGQKRRLALARLLAAEAPLWLLDEPSVGLDLASVGLLEQMIASHRAKGGMVILSTHAEIVLGAPTILHLDQFAPPLEQSLEVWQ